MQIVEDEHEGHRAARFLEHAGDRAEQQVTVGLRLAGDEGDPAGTLVRLVEQVRKTLTLCAAPDVPDRWHLAQPWRQRDRAELGGGRLPDHLERGEWLREALQGEVAGGSELPPLAR